MKNTQTDKRNILHISRVFSGASVANVKRRCIRILQVQTFAADAPLKTRPQVNRRLRNRLHTL